VIRVLIADDHVAIRSGLAMIVGGQPDMEVVGEADNGQSAVWQAKALGPDVVLMDIRMPGMDGIAATGEITAGGGGFVLILTTFDVDEYIFGALRAGAAGFLLKTASAASITAAIRSVAAGEGALTPAVTRKLISEFVRTAPKATAAPEGYEQLTGRERDVLDRLGDGLSNAELSRALGISETTAKTHVSRVLAKLRLSSRVQAAIVARELR
jgi:DNA-binding NarL/FixJ family response regulator